MGQHENQGESRSVSKCIQSPGVSPCAYVRPGIRRSSPTNSRRLWAFPSRRSAASCGLGKPGYAESSRPLRMNSGARMNRWKIVEGYFSFGARVSVVRSSCLGVDITSHRSKHVDEFAGQDFDCPTIGQEHLFQPPEHWLGQLGWAGRRALTRRSQVSMRETSADGRYPATR